VTDDHFGVPLAAAAAAAAAVAAAAAAVAAAAAAAAAAAVAAAAAGGETEGEARCSMRCFSVCAECRRLNAAAAGCWLHKGEAACGAQATLGLQGDTGDVGEMLEMLEMLEKSRCSSWARCCWRRRPGQERRPARRPGHASQAAPPAPKGPTAVPRRPTRRRLRGHTAAALAFAGGDGRNRPRPEDPAPIRQAVPSRTQREQARSGVTSHLTLEWRQLMQASLISLVSPQGNCGGEGLRLDGYGPLNEGAPGEVGCFRGRFVSGLWGAEAHL